jgi:hypothetical protein
MQLRPQQLKLAHMSPNSERVQDASILSAYWSQPIDRLLASLHSAPSGL